MELNAFKNLEDVIHLLYVFDMKSDMPHCKGNFVEQFRGDFVSRRLLGMPPTLATRFWHFDRFFRRHSRNLI